MAAPAPALEIFHPLFPPGEKPSLKGYERLVHTKQTEIDLVMTENAQLRLAMDRLERELTTLAEALQEKDREVRKMQISIDDRDHEIRQLSVVRSQSEGKDEAKDRGPEPRDLANSAGGCVEIKFRAPHAIDAMAR